MSLGPVGPYLDYDHHKDDEIVICQHYYTSNHILGPNNCGGIKCGLCMWALLGPEMGFIDSL